MMAIVMWLVPIPFLDTIYSHPFYYFWDAAITFVTFALFAIIIARLKTALDHADERFLTVLEGLDSAVFVTDENGELLYGNEQFHKSFGAGVAFLDAVRDGTGERTFRVTQEATLHPGAREGEFHDAGRRRWYLIRSRAIQRVRAFVSKREPTFTDCDLNEVIRGVAALIEIEAETNGVAVSTELAAGLPLVRADPVMIEQVILNLAKNAIETMQETAIGLRQLAIRSCTGPANAVAVSRDHGVLRHRHL